MYQATIIKGCEHRLEIHRLMVWRDGKLVLVRTHVSRGGALSCYRDFLRNAKGDK